MVFSGTRRGRKHAENEDYHGHWQIAASRFLLAIADGISSNPFGGSVARWLIANAPSHARDGSLREIVQRLHNEIRSEFDEFVDFLESGASIAFVLISGNTAHVLWAGDSPVFHATAGLDGPCVRLTVPHSSSQDVIDNWFAGDRELSPEETTVDLAHNDVLTICSDGTVIDEASLGAAVSEGLLSQAYIDELLDNSVVALDSDDATIICYRHSDRI